MTWLRIASRNREVESKAYDPIIKFPIHNGARGQAKTSAVGNWAYGGPPLYVVSAAGLVETVRRLLQEGGDPDETNGIDGFSQAAKLRDYSTEGS